jgi:hypothetical protein
MNKTTDWNERDPLGLTDLPLLEPDKDGWDAISLALEEHQQRMLGGFAMAASLVLVIGIAVNRPAPQEPEAIAEPTQLAQEPLQEPTDDAAAIEDLIAMSQILEGRLRALRNGTGAVPANSLTYIAELEDLVAQVDGQLNFAPHSVDLWGQRVNLLLDLELIYQHHWEREYGRMASL